MANGRAAGAFPFVELSLCQINSAMQFPHLPAWSLPQPSLSPLAYHVSSLAERERHPAKHVRRSPKLSHAIDWHGHAPLPDGEDPSSCPLPRCCTMILCLSRLHDRSTTPPIVQSDFPDLAFT